MADIKTQKDLNDAIKEQQKLLEGIDIGSKKYLATQKQIVILEQKKKGLLQEQKNIASTSTKDQVSFANKFNTLLKERENKEKDLAKQEGLGAKLQRGATQNQIRLLDTLNAQVDITKKSQGQTNKETENTFNALQKLVSEEQSVENLQTQIEESKRRQNNLSEDFQPILSDNEKGFRKILEDQLLITKAQNLLNGAVDKMKSIIKGITLASIFASVMVMAKKFGSLLDNIGTQFGSLDNLGGDIVGQLNASTVEAEKLGMSQAEVLASTTMLSSEFGVSLEQAAGLSAEIAETAKATGLSVDEATKLTGELRIISGLSQEQSEALIKGTSQLARQAGVAPQAVLKDIAGSSETIATFTKQGGENLFEAAVQARMFGLNLDSVAKAARSTLDFESSISAEVEASVMLGKQLNLQKAREAALNKDLVGFQKEIKNQLGGIGDFNKLNVFQQESLAKALGMSVSEVAKLSSGTEKLSVAGALAAGGFEGISGQQALSNLSSITNEVKSLFTDALILIGPAIEDIVGKFRTFLEDSGNISFLKDVFMSIAGAIQTVIQYGPALLTMFAGIKAAGFAMAIAQTIAAIAGSAAATPYLLGGGAVIAAAAIGTALAGAASLVPSFDTMSPAVANVVSGGPSTKAMAQIQGGEGVFNEKGLQDIVGNNNNQGSMIRVVEAVDNVQRAIKELTISTSVTSNQLNIVLDGGLGGD